MDWIQVITIVGSNLLIMLTFFACSISLHISGQNEARSIADSVRRDIQGMANEMKDFHGRLCAIEERRSKNG